MSIINYSLPQFKFLNFFLVLRIDIIDVLRLEEECFFPNNIIIAQNINMYTKIIIIIIKIEYNQTVDWVLINN